MFAKPTFIKTLSNEETNALVALANALICLSLYGLASINDLSYAIVSASYTLFMAIGVAKFYSETKNISSLIDTAPKQYMAFIHVLFYALLTLS